MSDDRAFPPRSELPHGLYDDVTGLEAFEATWALKTGIAPSLLDPERVRERSPVRASQLQEMDERLKSLESAVFGAGGVQNRLNIPKRPVLRRMSAVLGWLKQRKPPLSMP
jgi:hypothetical protein